MYRQPKMSHYQLLRLFNLKIKLYYCAKIREKHFLYLWVSSQAGIQMLFLENIYIGDRTR